MTPEGIAKKEITDGLKDMGWLVIRIQSGQVKVRGAWMHLAPNGTPDVLAFDREGVLLWVEVKAGKGKRRTEQIEFSEWAQRMGHRYVCARSLDEVLDALKS